MIDAQLRDAPVFSTDVAYPKPVVSVVMPIRNEERFIRRSLGAVLAQDYPADRLEVLVVDGMSSDGTRAIVRSLQQAHPAVRLIDNPGRIVPTGLNRALAQARGAIIVRVDGHTEIAPNYVRVAVSELLRSGADNVGGKMSAVGVGAFGEAVALATSSPFGVGGARFHYSDREEWVDTVYMGAWHRRVFERIGGFDEELVRDQDDELNYRLRKHGGTILLSPRLRSRYTVRGSLRSLWRQYFQYGFWKVRVLQKHPRQMRPRQFVPPTFVAALIGSALLAPLGRAGRLLCAAVVGAYISANLAASAWVARRGSRACRPWLPLVFAALHLGYGSGFLVGLARFAHRWREGDAGPTADEHAL